MNDYDYLLKQLDLLIGFLNVSVEDVYTQIKDHDRFNLGITIEHLYESSYENYSNHITTSALLLGFSHFEDFMTKCIVNILCKYPKNNKYKVTYLTIIEKGGNLINFLAKENVKQLTFSDKIKFIEQNLNGLDKQLIEDIRFVNNIRNCLMHNNGLADVRLNLKFIEGQRIILTTVDVNGYGLKARRLADEIWKRI